MPGPTPSGAAPTPRPFGVATVALLLCNPADHNEAMIHSYQY